jgi:hypothetical protein
MVGSLRCAGSMCSRILVVAGLVLFGAINHAASAQRTLSPHTRVRVALTSQRVIEGRVAAGDSSSLVIVNDGVTSTIARDSIATLTVASSRTVPYAIGIGAAGAVVTGALFGLASEAFCEGSHCRNAFTDGAVAGAGVGLAGGAALGAIVGSLVHRWKTAPTTARVVDRPVGATAIDRCSSASGFDAQAVIGGSSLGGRYDRLQLTAVCRPQISVGAEVGELGNVTTLSQTITSGGSTIQVFQRSVKYAGAVTEVPLHRVLNPRLIASIGEYRVNRLHVTQTNVFSPSGNTYSTSSSREISNHAGGGVGLSVSLPLWRYVSLGAEARAHVASGSRPITVLGVSVRIAR